MRVPGTTGLLSVLIAACPALAEESILEAARLASIASEALPESGEASGTFIVRRRHADEEEETLWTDGDFKLWFSGDKQCLDLTYRHDKRSTVLQKRDGTVEEFIADSPPDRVVVIDDSTKVTVVTFSHRFRQSGCRIEIRSGRPMAMTTVGFPLDNPARPQLEVLHVGKLIENLGAEAISFSAPRNGIAHGICTVRNSPDTYVRFDIDQNRGNNVVAQRVFVKGHVGPLAHQTLDCERKDSAWFVNKYTDLRRYKALEGEISWHRSSVTYDHFGANVKIDETVFDVASYPISPKTRTLDRR